MKKKIVLFSLIKQTIENNELVIVGVYEKECVVSNFFKGTLNKINEITCKKVIVSLIEKSEYEKIFDENKKRIFPMIIVYKNGLNLKKIYGFCNYLQVYNELKHLKLS